VANIVEACSDSLAENPDEKPPWQKRKEDYLAHLRATSDPSVYLVSAADKLHNLRSMTSDFAVVGHDLWSRFNKDAGMAGVLWYYRSLVSIYDTIDDPRVSRVAAQLKATFRRLENASAANDAQQLKTDVL
jgi:(p)ppGpp synthase/HD superfamily hydrolase